MRIILISVLLFSSFSISANTVETEWDVVHQKFHKSMKKEEFLSAYKAALTLNRIEPTDTNVLLYIVLTAVKSDTKLPLWVMAEPWPNATSEDRINRMIAEEIIKGG